MVVPKRSLAEYFNAKGIDPKSLKVVKQFDNVLALAGGVTMHKVGSPSCIPKCTSLPNIAKRVNRAVGQEIFGYKNFFNLSHHNMNGCEILFEEFGDIYLIWIAPNPITLSTYLNEALKMTGVWSYYNHGIIVGASTEISAKEQELSVERLEYLFRGLHTMIGEDFIYHVMKDRKVIGCNGNHIYLQDESGESHVTLHVMIDKEVEEHFMETTTYIKRIVDACSDSKA